VYDFSYVFKIMAHNKLYAQALPPTLNDSKGFCAVHNKVHGVYVCIVRFILLLPSRFQCDYNLRTILALSGRVGNRVFVHSPCALAIHFPENIDPTTLDLVIPRVKVQCVVSTYPVGIVF